jgi:hypothetical protein
MIMVHQQLQTVALDPFSMNKLEMHGLLLLLSAAC